jgi:hypothetical protein
MSVEHKTPVRNVAWSISVATLARLKTALVGCVVMFVFLAAPASANAKVLVGWGRGCVSIGRIALPADGSGKRAGLGYQFSYFGVFGLDLWTWDGAYCVYDETDFKTISEIEAVRIAKEYGFVLAPPFSYRVPSGLLVISVIGVLGVPTALLRRRMLRTSAPSTLDLSGPSDDRSPRTQK